MKKKVIIGVIIFIIIILLFLVFSGFYLWPVCKVSGGELQQGYLNKYCNYKTSDAGKVCSDSSECESVCIYYPNENEISQIANGGLERNGTCYEWKRDHGGYYVYNGKVDGAVAVD